jgi:hypothetical protein
MNFFNNIFKKKKADTNIDIKNEKKELRHTFLFSLFIGLLLIFASIIVNESLDNFNLHAEILFWINIAVEFFKNIGIALVIAYIFSFVSSTQIFIEFVKKRLIGIINTKDYLKKLSTKEQREMLENTLKSEKEPSYKEINSYFDKHINQSLSLYKTHFRSSYQLNAIAKIDNNIVCVDFILRYRMYPVDGKYENLNVGFEDKDVKLKPIEIITPDGEKKELETKLLSKNDIRTQNISSDFSSDPTIVNEMVAELPQAYFQHKYLDVVDRATEYGNDHWHLFTLMATGAARNRI